LAANGATLADLSGAWNYNSFVSGPSAPWWERGTLTVKPDGTFTGSGKDSNGNPDSLSGAFSISSDGIVMTGGGYSDTPLCQIDSGNTVLVCTHISSDDSSNLTIFTKQAASYSPADLVGEWEANFLSSGPTPWWATMSDTTYPDGTYKGTLTSSDGSSTGTSGKISISPTGAITCLSGDCLSSPNNYAAFMGADKTVTVGTSGAASGQDAVLSVFSRQAASYSMADLAGVWQGSSLASGPGAPWWERDSLTIETDGTYTVSWTASDGSSGTGTGTLSISSDGAISCVSGDCADRTYMSFMDAGKTVSAGAHTWPDEATREIKIFTKDSVADARAAARSTVAAGPAGSLKVTITPTAAVSAGAKWKVDGGTWQKSGATVGKLSVGSHTVNFNTIAGWTSPASQPVNIVSGQTASAGGLYVQQTGSLTVTISPDAAVNAGAMWNVDAGTWQNSGITVPGLSLGSHKVTFKAVTGWNTPKVQSVKILNGQTTSAQGLYVQQTGSVTVTITPAAAVKAGAEWCVTAPGSEECGQPSFNGPWQKSGATVKNLLVGIHTVGFNAVAGWAPPDPFTVDVEAWKDVSFGADWHMGEPVTTPPTFTPTSAHCSHYSGGCTKEPCVCGVLCPACSVELDRCDLFLVGLGGTACGDVGAQFTSYAGNATAHNSTPPAKAEVSCGDWHLSKSLLGFGGGHPLCARGNNDPKCTHVNVVVYILSTTGSDGSQGCTGDLGELQAQIWGQVTNSSEPGDTSGQVFWPAGSFSCPGSGKPTCGFLTVTISPADAVSAGAQWNVDGGAWQNSGARVAQLSAGNHTVNFNTISGWTSPTSQTVKIVVGQTASATGTYVAAAAPLSFTPVSAQCVYASGGCPPPYPTMGWMVYSLSGVGTACGPPGASIELSIFSGTVACDQWTADPATMSCARGSGQQECTTVNFTGQNVGGPNGCASFDPQETATVSGIVNGVYSSTGAVHIPMCCQGSQGSCNGGSAARMRRSQQK